MGSSWHFKDEFGDFRLGWSCRSLDSNCLTLAVLERSWAVGSRDMLKV